MFALVLSVTPPSHRRLALILLLLLAMPAVAVEIRLQPDPLRQGEPAFVLLDNRLCRFPLQQTVSPQRRGDVLEVAILGQDFCDPRLPAETRALALGRLPADVRLVRVLYCVGNVPPGAEPCAVALQGAVLPGGRFPAHAVPLSPHSGWIAVLLLLGLGLRRLHCASH